MDVNETATNEETPALPVMTSTVFDSSGQSRIEASPPDQVERYLDRKVQERVREEVAGMRKSAARERLERLARGTESIPARRLVISGEEWFVDRLDIEGITRVCLLAARDRTNRLTLARVGVMKGLLASMLFCCCVVSETDKTPFFETREEAYDQATSQAPAVVDMNAQLFAAILEINPEIIQPEVADEGEPGDSDAGPLASGTD